MSKKAEKTSKVLWHLGIPVYYKYAAFPGALSITTLEGDNLKLGKLIEDFGARNNGDLSLFRFVFYFVEEHNEKQFKLKSNYAILIEPLSLEKDTDDRYILAYRVTKRVQILPDKRMIELDLETNYKLNPWLKDEENVEHFVNEYGNKYDWFFLAMEVTDSLEDLVSEQNPLTSLRGLYDLLATNIFKLTDENRLIKPQDTIFLQNPVSKRPFTYDTVIDLIKRFEPHHLDYQSSAKALGVHIATLISLFDSRVVTKKDDKIFGGMTFLSYEDILGSVVEFFTTMLQLDQDLNEDMNQKLTEQQKEFMLREKMRAIQNKLEEMNASPNEEDEYALTIRDPKLSQMYPKSVQKVIDSETKRVSEMMQASPEATLAKTYIDIMKKLPWRKTEKEYLDMKRVRKVLDENHYGLDKAKERIIEYLAVIINQKLKTKNSDDKKLINIDEHYQIDLNLFKEGEEAKKRTFNNVPIIALVGPPGTGKTSLSKAIAEALNRKFIKVSLGGVHDESEIRGHRRTYVGAMPGKIIKGINQAGVSNPVILLDEIDKMKSDMKGDPASAMLEVLDPEQNIRFQDHYLEHEYDLSKAIFIATANYYEYIPEPLLDRVEIIELSSYTLSEKVNIARKHLIPKVVEQTALDKKYFQVSDETLEYIIKHYTREAGVRGLKRLLDKIARKIVVKLMENKKLKANPITIEQVTEYLGVIQFKEETQTEVNLPGIVNGLAYTSYGGSTLQIEVNTFKGKSDIKLTGSLKEVMQESAQIALSYVKSNAEEFGISDFDFEENTIHIHVPEGAVPKDGPSAGVTFTTALISALSNRAVPHEIGMTGEITLRGKVLEIGGLKEKSFAASQKGLKYIFIPAGNAKNIQEIPNEIKCSLTYIPVKEYKEIFDFIFLGKKPQEVITTACEEKK
ncbi:endopeptidase La [Mycoplasma buteonis]|uniref:endopeptidase La n=1 Tax=Mycoplasma buteonis TaxID=171280 RepID=UPI000563DE11|nr:endopeptidase La [Mycoplasma buteonis]